MELNAHYWKHYYLLNSELKLFLLRLERACSCLYTEIQWHRDKVTRSHMEISKTSFLQVIIVDKVSRVVFPMAFFLFVIVFWNTVEG